MPHSENPRRNDLPCGCKYDIKYLSIMPGLPRRVLNKLFKRFCYKHLHEVYLDSVQSCTYFEDGLRETQELLGVAESNESEQHQVDRLKDSRRYYEEGIERELYRQRVLNREMEWRRMPTSEKERKDKPTTTHQKRKFTKKQKRDN